MTSITAPRWFSPCVLFSFGIIVLLPIGYMFTAVLDSGILITSGRALFEKRQLGLAGNSLIIGFGTTCLSVFIGVTTAVLIYRTDLWVSNLFRMIWIVPILIPPFIHAIVWTHINPMIMQVFSADIHSPWGVIWILSLAYFPFATLMTVSGLRSIDRNQEEASILTRGRWPTLRRITLPLIAPHIILGAVFIFIFSILDFSVPDILRVRVFPLEVFIQFSALYDTAAATILSLPLMSVGLLLVILQKWQMQDRSFVQTGLGEEEELVYPLGRLGVPAFGFCLVVFALGVAVPVAVLMKTAGNISISCGSTPNERKKVVLYF